MEDLFTELNKTINHYRLIGISEDFCKEFEDRVQRIIKKYENRTSKLKRAGQDRHLKVKRGY